MYQGSKQDLTFIMVGHAHIDPIWLWEWREGFETVKATFRSALDRMQENPDLVFVHSSAAQYAWMETHPTLLAEIRQAVERGQWEPAGGFWVEPDSNIPSGEALARQGLYGQRYFQHALGRRSRVAFLPDSFGHPSTLPQIFRLCGMDSFLFLRPTGTEIDLPSNLFWWEGPDGSRVLAARAECYNTNPLNVSQSLERNLAWRPEGEPEWIGLYGVGNHGGGPTRRLIQNIRDLDQDPAWPALKFGSLESFFERAAARPHPTVTKSLQHTARGCYTSHSEIKRLNRKGEQALLTAEKWAVLAGSYGMAYPVADLNRAWRHLLFHQFHDVICGTSIQPAYVDARNELGEALGTANRVLYNALQTISQQVETRSDDHQINEVMRRVRTGPGNAVADLGDGVPVLVFNPSPWPRREVVDIEVNDWFVPEMRVLDDANNPVVHQFAKPEAIPTGRMRAAFLAEVPPLGYRLYRLIDQPPALPEPDGADLTATLIVMENTWWRLTLDPKTGTLASLIDKRRGADLLAGSAAQLLVIEDRGGAWGAPETHNRRLIGPFGQPSIQLLENGPVRATWLIRSSYKLSTAMMEISLYRESPAIEGRLRINWNQQYETVKLAFPFALSNPTATFSAPYGHEVRPTAGQEEPMQQWLDISGILQPKGGKPAPCGVALLNDCKYGADVMGAEARITVLRSPGYTAGTYEGQDHSHPYPHLDQGWQEMRWALVPHGGDWAGAQVVQRAQDFNDPLQLVREYAHAGSLPRHHSFIEISPPDALVLTALKRAEEGDALILRLYEPHGRAAAATVTLPQQGIAFAAAAGPNQIITYRIEGDGAVRPVNLLEE